MRLTITIYLDIISSWCFWSIPTWQELQRRYRERADFTWKIALMDAIGMPKSRLQMEWFYRRSGMLNRSPFMLQTSWHEPGRTEYLPPNCVAEAARELGVADDRVWLALSRAELREGKKIGDWEIAAEIAAAAGGLEKTKLLARAQSPETEKQIRLTTAEFHAMQVTQRPTFVIDTPIGDRAVFSGLIRLEPIVATIEAMFEDIAGYAAHAAHFGEPPP